MNKIVDYLIEAKSGNTIVMFHGTSSHFLRSILVNGVIPEPPNQVYDTVKNAHQDMRSLKGSYWTANLGTAAMYSLNAIEKFGGSRLYVIADISHQSGYSDEESALAASSVNGMITEAYNDINHQRIATGSLAYIATWFFSDEEFKLQLGKKFQYLVHNALRTSAAQPYQDGLLIQLLYYKMALSLLQDPDWLRRYMNTHDGKRPFEGTVQELLDAYKVIQDRISRYYKKFTDPRVDKWDTRVRLLDTVGYSGANRIICILEDIGLGTVKARDGKGTLVKLDRTGFNLWYGEIPPEWIKEYNEKRGRWHEDEVFDKRGMINQELKHD